MGKKKHVQSEEKPETENKDAFNLENVLKLGGTKKDFEWLVEIQDEEEVLDKEDINADPVNRKALEQMVAELGFYEEEEETDKEKEKPKEKKKKKEKIVETQEVKEETGETSGEKKAKKIKNKFKVQCDEVTSTVVEKPKKVADDVENRAYLFVKPGGKWHDNEFINDPTEFEAPRLLEVQRTKAAAAVLFDAEVEIFNKQQLKNSEARWMKTMLTKGTLGDKLASLTLHLQEAPVHNLTSVDSLIAMTEKKGRREATMAAETFKDLMLSDLLPDRKLRSFDQRPLNQLDELSSGNFVSRNKRLLLWYYEGELKSKFSLFLDMLEKLLQDNISQTKQKILGIVYQLLANKPEQEKRLLTLLVNKVGDPERQTAAKSIQLLTRLVGQHPNMKPIVTQEVERLLFRPNVANKAQYYGVCFLHSIQLRPNTDNDLATRLVNLYFSLFQLYIKRGEVDGKMLRALLTGVNNAYSVAKVERAKIVEHVDMLYRVVHVVNFKTSLQALSLLYQVMETEDSSADRFYMALYNKLIDPALLQTAHQPLFLNLMFRALSNDPTDRRVKAFIKRLLQICCYMQPTFTCGSLILISEILKTKKHILILSKEANSSAIKQEIKQEEPKIPIEIDEEDDELEHFVDAPEEEEDDGDDVKSDMKHIAAVDRKPNLALTSWEHRRNIPFIRLEKDPGPRILFWRSYQTTSLGGDLNLTGHCLRGSQGYDAHNRNPLYCGADTECIWELQRLSTHYHPSVAMFASTLLQKRSIKYNGKPLDDFTLARFLDRFVFRNPKKNVATEEKVTKTRRHGYVAIGVRAMPINSEQFLNTDAEKVPVDERFFHEYFKQNAKKKPQKTKKRKEHDGSDSEGSIDDDDFDDFLDRFEAGTAQDKDVELDFASEYSKQKASKKKKGNDDEEEESDLSEEDDIDFDDDEDLKKEFEREMAEAEYDDEEEEEEEEEMAGQGEDVVLGGSDGEEFDEEAVSFSDEDEEVEKKTTSKRKKSRDLIEDYDDEFEEDLPEKRSKNDLTGLFASADEFADVLEETGDDDFNTGGTDDLDIRSTGDMKQVKWEAQQSKKEWKKKKSEGARKKGGGGAGGSRGNFKRKTRK